MKCADSIGTTPNKSSFFVIASDIGKKTSYNILVLGCGSLIAAAECEHLAPNRIQQLTTQHIRNQLHAHWLFVIQC